VRCSRAGERRAASAWPSLCHRSTEAPDAFGAPAASSPARARVRHPPLPHPRPSPPTRAPGHDLDGKSIGPTAHGTDRSQVPVLRGGPQSFAPPTPGDLAAGASGVPAGVGHHHPSPAGSVRSQLRCATVPTRRLARSRAGGTMSWLRHFLLLPRNVLRTAIRGYQVIVSPVLPPSCRFTPSCSQYALEAVSRHGALKGSWMAARRLARCHPFHPGGFDPVP
jgi:putative membrane protein insertion efficiency factor